MPLALLVYEGGNAVLFSFCLFFVCSVVSLAIFSEMFLHLRGVSEQCSGGNVWFFEFVTDVCLFGIVFAQSFHHWMVFFSTEKCQGNCLFVRSCFFVGAFFSSCVSSSPLFVFFCFFFSLSLSLSLSPSLPLFLCLSEERKLRLTSHPPRHVFLGCFSYCLSPLPFFSLAFRPCVLPCLCFAGCVFWPWVLLGFRGLGRLRFLKLFFGRLSARRLVRSHFFCFCFPCLSCWRRFAPSSRLRLVRRTCHTYRQSQSLG